MNEPTLITSGSLDECIGREVTIVTIDGHNEIRRKGKLLKVNFPNYVNLGQQDGGTGYIVFLGRREGIRSIFVDGEEAYSNPDVRVPYPRFNRAQLEEWNEFREHSFGPEARVDLLNF